MVVCRCSAPDPPVETVAHRVAAGLPQMHAGAQAQNLWILYYSTFQRGIQWYFITKSMRRAQHKSSLVWTS
jgi:hypothetical protein